MLEDLLMGNDGKGKSGKYKENKSIAKNCKKSKSINNDDKPANASQCQN